MLLNNGFFLPRITTVTYINTAHETIEINPTITLTIRIGAENQNNNL